MFKILFIGDPHFKKDNGNETALMTQQMYNIITFENPNVIVILGDLMHYHEKSYTPQHVNSYRFIDILHTYMPIGSILIILIGNHDRMNNKVFMNDEHVFNPYKKWPNTYIIDTITPINIKFNEKEFKILAIPYVETGRFTEVLTSKGYANFSEKLKTIYGTKNFKMSEYLNEITYNLKDINLVLCHQEFLKCKMNSIESAEGDFYPIDLPMCVSGHIHDEDELQPNLYYPGTPIQHSYGDSKDKCLSIFIYDENFKMIKNRRLALDIPKKLQFTMTPQELLSFVPPPNSNIKIKLKGNAQENADIMKLDYVVELLRKGIIITSSETAHQLSQISLPQKDTKINVPYNQRLIQYMNTQSPELQNIFKSISN